MLTLTPANARAYKSGQSNFWSFLREVWTEGSIDHLSCPESKAEREAEGSQLAAHNASIATHTDVEIAFLESPR